MAKLSQLHPLLMIRFRQKMVGLQRKAVVDEASVAREVREARETVGEVDIAGKEADEDTVEGGLTETVADGAVSGPWNVR